MIQVGNTGLYFDGGHKGNFKIYIMPKHRIIRNDHKDLILKLEGENVDCSGAIFDAIYHLTDFYSDTIAKRFLKNHEWLIKECIKEQIKGNQSMGKCYECGVDPNPTYDVDSEEYCYLGVIAPTWDRTYVQWNTNLRSDKFVDMSNAPLTQLKDLDLRSTYICGIHMICKIKSLKKPVVSKGFYCQECVFYEDNTSKTVKGLLKDGVADFDKWHNGDKVELFATFEDNKLNVTSMELVEENDSEPIMNRNDETPGYNDWRQSIISRDKKCVCCGLDKHLEAHHLFGYKENPYLAVNESNGVTLCKFCHNKYHSIYGLKDINPVDFMDFIKKYGVR